MVLIFLACKTKYLAILVTLIICLCYVVDFCIYGFLHRSLPALTNALANIKILT